MKPERLIWGLDLGVRTGFAYGRVGAAPTSGTALLTRRGEGWAKACSELQKFIRDQWREHGVPDIVAVEEAMLLGAFVRVNSSQANVNMHYGLRGALAGICGAYGAKLAQVHRATVVKHFLGKGGGKREAIKDAIVLRCHVLGLMPREKFDQDRADAIATFDWACATFTGRIGALNELHFFGEHLA